MPRQPRIEFPDSLHHIMARGINGQDIFLDKKDLLHFRKRLGELIRESTNQCFAWALMKNHFHLLIRSGNEPLSRVMRRLLTGHAVYFNRRHKRSGHLFQNRFKSILCQEDLYFLQLVRYIHLNPIRAGEVKTIKTLNKYPFTGHSALIEEEQNDWQNVDYTLNWFGKRKKKSIEKYLDHIKDGLKEGKREDLTGGGLLRTVGGWKKLQELRRSGKSVSGDERMLGDSDFVETIWKQSEDRPVQTNKSSIERLSLEQLVKNICDYFQVNPIDVCSAGKNHQITNAKSLICYSAIRLLSYSGNEVAGYLNINKSSVSRMVSRFQRHEILHRFLKKHPL